MLLQQAAKATAATAGNSKHPAASPSNPSAVASTSAAGSSGAAAVPYNQAPISTNRTAAAFTSTSAAVSTKSENAKWDEEYLMYEEVKDRAEKGYARMVTNYGALNFEVGARGSSFALHLWRRINDEPCLSDGMDLVPLSCTPTWPQRRATTSSVCVVSAFFSFLFAAQLVRAEYTRPIIRLNRGEPHTQLARDGYYANIKFHRLIPGFMVRAALSLVFECPSKSRDGQT